MGETKVNSHSAVINGVCTLVLNTFSVIVLVDGQETGGHVNVNNGMGGELVWFVKHDENGRNDGTLCAFPDNAAAADDADEMMTMIRCMGNGKPAKENSWKRLAESQVKLAYQYSQSTKQKAGRLKQSV